MSITQKPHPNAVGKPDAAGKWWFAGVSLDGLTTTPVQNRPIRVDSDMRLFDAMTGLPIVGTLRGTWIRDEDMGR